MDVKRWGTRGLHAAAGKAGAANSARACVAAAATAGVFV
jgi:hypothetical protein